MGRYIAGPSSSLDSYAVNFVYNPTPSFEYSHWYLAYVQVRTHSRSLVSPTTCVPLVLQGAVSGLSQMPSLNLSLREFLSVYPGPMRPGRKPITVVKGSGSGHRN